VLRKGAAWKTPWQYSPSFDKDDDILAQTGILATGILAQTSKDHRLLVRNPGPQTGLQKGPYYYHTSSV
jgi:hypothetical protein